MFFDADQGDRDLDEEMLFMEDGVYGEEGDPLLGRERQHTFIIPPSQGQGTLGTNRQRQGRPGPGYNQVAFSQVNSFPGARQNQQHLSQNEDRTDWIFSLGANQAIRPQTSIR